MKKLIFTLATLIVFGSCRTIEKMVEKGQYDEAIIYATEKLAGKKYKKTKHVKALEEAFMKINERDMDQINYLDGTAKPENWDKIYDIADRMERRQNRIEPFLPLISKEGYKGYFEFVKTYEIKTKALNASAEHHYSRGEALLELSKVENDKSYARSAHKRFSEAEKRKPNYKDVLSKKREAYNLGQVHIKLEVENESLAVVPEDLERIILSMNVSRMNTTWRKYHTTDIIDLAFDYKAVVNLTSIEVSPERETVTHHEDTKEVKDGFRYLRDRKGEFVRDTSGQRIQVDNFVTIRAFVSEIFRENAARVAGQIEYINLKNGGRISTTPLNVEAIFSDYASSFRGDRRAICKHDINRLKSYPLNFPNDFEMILDATENLKGILVEELRSLPI